MDIRLRHARRQVAGRIGVLVAAVLVIPGLTLAPAQAALSSTALIPGVSDALKLVDPDLVGSGTVSGPGVNCVATGAEGVVSQCTDPLLAGDLTSVTDLLLTATPATGWTFDGWSGACTGTSPTCTLSATALTGALTGTPLAPIATFIPTTPGSGGSEPLPGTCEVGIADCTPPVTKLNSKPTVKPSKPSDGAGVTQADTATFTFQAFEPVEDSNPPVASTTPTDGATFECKLLRKPATTPDFAACPGTASGSASYTALQDGTYEFSVRAVDADGNKDATPETFTWTVDTTAPETELNTRTKFWVLARKATFGLDVAPPDLASDVTFQCYLDGAGRACPTVRFAAGTHTFGAAAQDKAGNTDESPVTHTFTMPINNKDLGHSKGWTKAKVKGTFLNTASITKRKGAKVATKATGITRIALVASKGKGFGTVKVMLGKKTLKQVKLTAKRNVKKKLVPIARFSTPTSGKVTVQVVSQGKKVVIEGLGIATG